ncbi:hypothetical protein LCGC14_1212060 [marine sediment metagenome]|uniref:Uncharacterized protein n=1 Tax=marine sediment metagenome TaxID=412755 RepID=A0A0F9NW18_9ZZZZ
MAEPVSRRTAERAVPLEDCSGRKYGVDEREDLIRYVLLGAELQRGDIAFTEEPERVERDAVETAGWTAVQWVWKLVELAGWVEEWHPASQPGEDIKPLSEWRKCVSVLWYRDRFLRLRASEWDPMHNWADIGLVLEWLRGMPKWEQGKFSMRLNRMWLDGSKGSPFILWLTPAAIVQAAVEASKEWGVNNVAG